MAKTKHNIVTISMDDLTLAKVRLISAARKASGEEMSVDAALNQALGVGLNNMLLEICVADICTQNVPGRVLAAAEVQPLCP